MNKQRYELLGEDGAKSWLASDQICPECGSQNVMEYEEGYRRQTRYMPEENIYFLECMECGEIWKS